MQEQLDRIEKKIDGLISGLTNKQSPFDRDDDAPAQVRNGVEGFEKVFGPRPAGGTPEYKAWMKQIPLTTKVHGGIPEEYEANAMELASKTGAKTVFVEHEGKLKIALNVKPDPWFIEPVTLSESLAGLIRSVNDRKAKGTL